MNPKSRWVRSGPQHCTTAALIVITIVIAAVLWGPGVTAAQVTATPAPLSCADLLPNVDKSLSNNCSALDRDQICYGNKSLTVEYQDPNAASTTPFDQPGNIAPVSAIKSIRTQPLNLERGEWGLAVLKVQANLPGTTAGQAVTFVLYGDTNLTNVTPTNGAAPAGPTCTATTARQTFLRALPLANAQQVVLIPANSTVNITGRLQNNSWLQGEFQGQTGWVFASTTKLNCDINDLVALDASQTQTTAAGTLPGMSAFYFQTGVAAQAACKNVPPGGLLVQSPKGQKVSFKANGVDITLGSSVIFRTVPGTQTNTAMVMSVLEGQGIVSFGGVRRIVNAGQGVTVPLGGGPNGLDPSGPPDPPRPMVASELFIPTVCDFSKAIGLTVPCVIVPPTATPRPRTPVPRPTFTPTPANSTGPTCTFTVQRFAADKNPVDFDYNKRAACTTLRWDVEGTDTMTVTGPGVNGSVGHGAQDICLQKSATYTLTMNCGGVSKSFSYTVNVNFPSS